MEIFLICVVAVIGFAIYSGVVKGKEIEAAKANYLQALAKLKKAPTDADIKQQTLALGRIYSNLTRDKKGNTVFDEVALMNDINAACAAASVSWKQSGPVGSPQPTDSVESRLETLKSLRDKGLIEPQEYEKRREAILSSI